MVDEPMGSARPNESGTAVRPTSQHEVEWRDGLSRLMSNLETELGRVVQTARRQVAEAVRGIEEQGVEQLTALDTSLREKEDERAAVEERVAEMQASIVAAEQEV